MEDNKDKTDYIVKPEDYPKETCIPLLLDLSLIRFIPRMICFKHWGDDELDKIADIQNENLSIPNLKKTDRELG